jgi:UDP-galactopyranose mutase
MNLNGLKYLVVGSGFWGSVIAERISSILNEKVLVVEKRNHFGGNSHSEIDGSTGIEFHRYGTHIFHTKSSKVWEYITKFGDFLCYQHRVYSNHNGSIFSMPINLGTINAFFMKTMNPSEATIFIQKEIEKDQPERVDTLEAKAISMIGKSLYDAFIKGYTRKQWGVDPVLLSPDIISRLPVRFNLNSNYFSDPYQGLPAEGYGSLFQRILNSKNIELALNTDYYSIRHLIPDSCKIFFSGPIDRFFAYKAGSLAWRSLRFEKRVLQVQDFQGAAVMNYPDEEVPFTRIHEFKHLHPERQVFHENRTLICYEYPSAFREELEMYYPVNDRNNEDKLRIYEEMARGKHNFVFGGRLGAYKYWDMDKAVENALTAFDVLKAGYGMPYA